MEKIRIRDGKKSDPGSRIRDKHPGSATLTVMSRNRIRIKVKREIRICNKVMRIHNPGFLGEWPKLVAVQAA
jgi:hypothetical protein